MWDTVRTFSSVRNASKQVGALPDGPAPRDAAAWGNGASGCCRRRSAPLPGVRLLDVGVLSCAVPCLQPEHRCCAPAIWAAAPDTEHWRAGCGRDKGRDRGEQGLDEALRHGILRRHDSRRWPYGAGRHHKDGRELAPTSGSDSSCARLDARNGSNHAGRSARQARPEAGLRYPRGVRLKAGNPHPISSSRACVLARHEHAFHSNSHGARSGAQSPPPAAISA